MSQAYLAANAVAAWPPAAGCGAVGGLSLRCFFLRFADGAADLERATELNPTHIASFRYLAIAYQKLGRSDDADKALEAAKGA